MAATLQGGTLTFRRRRTFQTEFFLLSYCLPIVICERGAASNGSGTPSGGRCNFLISTLG
jgi:hypothetical protein